MEIESQGQLQMLSINIICRYKSYLLFCDFVLVNNQFSILQCYKKNNIRKSILAKHFNFQLSILETQQLHIVYFYGVIDTSLHKQIMHYAL